jgi:uncharacterized membrane protein YhaH (DUF805 family)
MPNREIPRTGVFPMDWNWFLFKFNGRINRAKLWLAVLVMLCWMIFLGLLAVAFGSLFGSSEPTSSFSFGASDLFKLLNPGSWQSLRAAGLPMLLIKVVVTPLVLWVYLATSIKRLHDRDKSGWWMVPFFVMPGIFNELTDRSDFSHAAMALGVVTFGLYLWGFVEMYCLKGSHKTNRFGPDPLQPIDTKPRWDQQREIEMVPHKAGPPPVWYVKRSA